MPRSPGILSKKAQIDGGADINKKCSHGSTPVHCAAAYDRSEILKLLYENGGDIGASNDEGAAPVDFARRFGCSGTLSMLNRMLKI